MSLRHPVHCEICYNELQYTATYCNTLHWCRVFLPARYIATHRNNMQYTALVQVFPTLQELVQYTATHCNAVLVQVIPTLPDCLEHTATNCNTLLNAQTHCIGAGLPSAPKFIGCSKFNHAIYTHFKLDIDTLEQNSMQVPMKYTPV